MPPVLSRPAPMPSETPGSSMTICLRSRLSLLLMMFPALDVAALDASIPLCFFRLPFHAATTTATPSVSFPFRLLSLTLLTPPSSSSSSFVSTFSPFLFPLALYSTPPSTPPTSSPPALSASTALPSEAYRTCRLCLRPYLPSRNHDTACRYHPSAYIGNERSKFCGTRSGGNERGLARFWDCCGEESVTAPGCQPCPHESYDEGE
ncbi:hypothetical protein Naga_100801g1 [Nannochloropsis gaditana]|uniref:Uncharacterized protein n=1 Tax=Nannochloropsis gaditana TaxID=72520 RepID=W7TGD5_9STRA|nr:hypothetical protein Naga_100801g1 [Nannochloropsis gaditana]